ncbi:MAG: group I truncated hemoglobin [Phycisphaerae bacterium]
MLKVGTRVWAVGLAAAVLSLVGCSNSEMKSDSGAEKSLYDRLGGESAITAVVDDFVASGAANPKVNFTRKGTKMEWQATPENVAHMKKMLVQFICAATGGPQKYAGKDMKKLHTGMKISNAEFDALAADLVASLKKLSVPQKEIDELVAIVGTTRKDIVEVQ